MKRSFIFKAALLALTASLSLGLAACGGSDSSSKADAASAAASGDSSAAAEESKTDELKGSEQSWGNFTVLIPEGWTLKGGDVFDENDPNIVEVKKSDFSYIQIKIENEDVQKRQYEYNKKTYTLNQKDLSAATFAGIEWNGFEYGNELNPGYELYASSNGQYLRVSGVGFTFDSDVTKAVLGSLKVKEAAPAESTADEASAAEESSAADTSEEVSAPEESAGAVPVGSSFAEKATFTYNGVLFTVGDKMSSIKDQLGNEAKPSDTMVPCVDGAQEVELIYYPGLTFQVNYEGTIISIDLTEEIAPGTEGSLLCGLKVGDDKETAKRLLGEPDEDSDYGMTYKEDSKNLQVFFYENKINQIAYNDLTLPF